MKVVTIIQARVGSTRLPGKVLKDLSGRTVLAQVIRRVEAVAGVDAVVVATTGLAADDPVVAEARCCGALVSRGSEDDVLARYFAAAQEHAAEVIVRVTSDCPLFDPAVLEAMLAEFLEADGQFDYYSNFLNRRTFPTGLDAEIFTMAALSRAQADAVQLYEREHVTPYIYHHPELYCLGGMVSSADESAHRWTLDTPADWDFVQRVYAALENQGELFGSQEVLRLLDDQPELARINGHIQAKPLVAATVGGGLLLRVDASAAIGAGHLMRCLALAQAWPSARGPVCFALAEGYEMYAERLVQAGFTAVRLTVAVGGRVDAAATLALALERGVSWVVVDGYRFGAAYRQDLGRPVFGLLVIDDCGGEDWASADLVLNQNLHADAQMYRDVAGGTGLLLGLDYTLLRREFLAVPRSATSPVAVRRLLVTLGGGDADNVTARVMAALELLGRRDLQVRVLVGAANPQLAVLQSLAAASSVPIEIQSAVSNMPSQYAWADLAITGGGSTLWELMVCGLPALTLVLAANQEPSSRLLAQKGVVRHLGVAADCDLEQWAGVIGELCDDQAGRAAMITAGCGLVDGCGSERVVAAMLSRNGGI